MNKIEQYVKWFNDEHNVQIQCISHNKSLYLYHEVFVLGYRKKGYKIFDRILKMIDYDEFCRRVKFMLEVLWAKKS